jgi:hypothetical protein
MLTLFVENPVLFFGYSLGDPHVQRLLATLTECLTDEQLNTLNERLIFIGRVSDKRPPTLQRAPITVHGHTFYAYEVGLGDWEPLFTGLSEIPYHFAPRVLRRLRESVYLAARDANATTKVRVVDFEDDDDLNELEIVLGIGVMDKIAETGYTQVSISRYLHDMLHGKTELDAQRLAANTFKLFRQKFVPTFYVRRLAALQGTLEGVASQRQVQKWDQNNHDIRPYVTKEEEAALYGNFRNLLAAPIKEYRLHELPLWLKSWDVEDILALRDYLSSKLAERESPPTGIVKLCCLFDRLVYGGDFSGDTAELIGRLGLAPALFPHGGPSSS